MGFLCCGFLPHWQADVVTLSRVGWRDGPSFSKIWPSSLPGEGILKVTDLFLAQFAACKQPGLQRGYKRVCVGALTPLHHCFASLGKDLQRESGVPLGSRQSSLYSLWRALLSIYSWLWPSWRNEWEVWVLCVHNKVGSEFQGGLEGRGFESMEKTKWNHQGKEGNKITNCFSRLYFKMSSDWFWSQKGFRSNGFPAMMAKYGGALRGICKLCTSFPVFKFSWKGLLSFLA